MPRGAADVFPASKEFDEKLIYRKFCFVAAFLEIEPGTWMKAANIGIMSDLCHCIFERLKNLVASLSRIRLKLQLQDRKKRNREGKILNTS